MTTGWSKPSILKDGQKAVPVANRLCCGAGDGADETAAMSERRVAAPMKCILAVDFECNCKLSFVLLP